MTGTTISTSYLNGVTLSNAAVYNPVTILAGVTIADATIPALQATGTIDWTIANAGTLHSYGTTGGSYGLALQGGGTVTNMAGGVISGGFAGMVMQTVGTVANHGSITASNATNGTGIVLAGGVVANGVGASITGGARGIALNASGEVANNGIVQGLAADGVLLGGGGAVNNNTAASIIGYQAGLSLAGAGTVVNQGSIGATGTAGSGYTVATATNLTTLFDGGIILDTGVVNNLAAGTISDYFFGVAAAGVASVVNQGLITASSGSIGLGIFLPAGGSVSNAGSGAISGGLDGVVIGGSGGATAINQGSIHAGKRAGIDLFSAGYASNAASGTITGYLGVLLRSTGQVINAGSIVGARYGIDMVAAGTVTNAASANVTAAVGIGELAGGSADNLGTIVATGTTAKGVFLYAAGYVSNAATGTISSGSDGVFVQNGAGTVTNFGSISSSGRITYGAGIKLTAGGTVTNAAGARVTTQLFGVQIYGSGTVLNQGFILADDSIKGYGAGVWVKGPADISNASSGTISGGLFAVVLYDQSTLTNAGTIFATSYAVQATPGFADRFIVVPGATFTGTVNGGNAPTSSIASVLELTTGSMVGTITGFGSKYTGLQQVVLDAGASWSLGGTVASAQTVAFGGPGTTLTLANPGSMSGLINGFSAHDTIVLAGVTGVTSATLNVVNQLTVVPGSGPDLTIDFSPTQTFSGTNFNFVAVGGNTDLTVPCFAAGTRIATPAGEVAVERLRVGDVVLTRRGARLPVAWLGHRRTDCRRHPRPREVWPVRVREGAFGAGMPHRSLLLSPDHAVFIEGEGAAPGILIPIRYLINDATIVQVPVDGVTYWHIELDRHEVILAEGLACESYLDTGNRGAFANGGGAAHMHADFARNVWQVSACAPLVLQGAELAAARFRLLERAGTLGYAMTSDAALRLVVDGRELHGTNNRFHLPAAAGHVRLVSRCAVPAHVRHDSNDYRRLGVAVSCIALDGEPIALTDPRLGSGWHEPEAGWRWTDGDASLEVAGAHELQIEIALTGRYRLPPMGRTDFTGTRYFSNALVRAVRPGFAVT